MTDTASALSPDQRRAKADKVRALRAKTVASGATPEEAASASAMADQLQAKYGLTDAETRPSTKSRSQQTFDDIFADIFGTGRRANSQPADDEATAARKASDARKRYRTNGVHVPEPGDPQDSYYSDCTCRNCNGKPKTTSAPRQPRRPRPNTNTNCNCSECRAARAKANNEAPKAEQPKAKPAGRKNTSHKYCDHENTSAARARCRKQNA